MVLLADVARIQDTGLMRESIGFSMNAFIRLWNRVGYLLSSSEEDLIQNATEENMHLLPYDDALEFITQHLTRPGKLLLKIFNRPFKGNRKPTTETVLIEPLTDNDGPKLEASDDSSDCSERSPEVGMDRKAGLRAGSKRGEASLNDSTESDENRKKSKTGNSGQKKKMRLKKALSSKMLNYGVFTLEFHSGAVGWVRFYPGGVHWQWS